MNRSKHLYHVIFVKVDNHIFKPCASINICSNSKRDLYKRCAEWHPDMIPFEVHYIK